MENDKSLAGIEGSLSDEENFISISSDDDADYDATINMVNEYLSNYSNANLEVGSSSSVGKVQGHEDVYVFDSDDDMASLSATAPPMQDYVGKGKQRADPVPEDFNFHSNSKYDTQAIQTPQDQNVEVVMSDANNPPSFPNKNSVERNVALFPSQPPNFPDWITRDIMIPCPLSETQRALISNLILDRKLIQYLSKVSDNDKADADSLIRTRLSDVLRIIDHEPVEAINGHLFNGPTHKKSFGYHNSEIKFSVEKLKMLRYILVQLKSFRLTIGIAASSGLSTDAMIRFMDRIGQKYGIINDESSKYNKNLYQEQEKKHAASFCVIFSTDFTNYHKNVLPKLDLVIAYDTSFKPNQHFYFSMGNLSIPVLRLVTCDTLEHVLVYGMKWFEDNKVTTGLTFESVWNYREKGDITADTLAECNINVSDSSDDEIVETIKNNVTKQGTKQGAKRQTVEAEPSCQKRSRPNRDEMLTVSQLKEHIQQQDEHILQQDERILQQEERILQQEERILQQDERILQQENMIRQLQEKNSELNCKSAEFEPEHTRGELKVFVMM
ncbi:5239_t:CDS:2 [Cetraspora pellucida]|uniref:5239_t:CDS:1 n=1 Tax=Cetraspora pellucida TaxID=1433469 RepID=A0ACA9KAQ8_9GLOM|nr:5239_t:CDS:2 [Cetraspora pellucida]